MKSDAIRPTVRDVQNNDLLVAIVDDEESVRHALSRLMRSAGLRVAVFGSGAEFLDSLKSVRPDCVVLDMHMPELSGLDVQLRLRAENDRLPVVIITGHDTAEVHRLSLEAGALAYLRKPIHDQTLLDAVADAAARGKSH
jgi:FixJ family two-component response regulator